MVPCVHDDELTREIVNSPKFFPAGWIEPYAVIERPGRYDQNLVCVNTFSLDALLHEPIQRYDAISSMQAVQQHA
jgi:hypothetical protein